MKPKVFVTRRLPEDLLEKLRQHAEVIVHPEEQLPVSRNQLLEGVSGATGILSLLTERIDEEVLSAAGPSLQVISNVAVGYDNIDVKAAKERGIWVTNTPGVLTETTADLTFALMLAVSRRVVEAERYLREGRWETWSPLQLTGQDVFGATLGIIGMGRIGQAVAKRARGFDMKVLYQNRTRNLEAEEMYGCQYMEQDELLKHSDFVVVLTPLTPETRGMIGKRELGIMKKTAVLINTSRGSVVDETALYEALKQNQIFGAGLDVYQTEPIDPEHPLLELQNVVLLPHIGSASLQTRRKMISIAIDNLIQVLKGLPPLYPL